MVGLRGDCIDFRTAALTMGRDTRRLHRFPPSGIDDRGGMRGDRTASDQIDNTRQERAITDLRKSTLCETRSEAWA
jgi:hypothetical protein